MPCRAQAEHEAYLHGQDVVHFADPECCWVSRQGPHILVCALHKRVCALCLWAGCIQHGPVLRPVVLQVGPFQLCQHLNQPLLEQEYAYGVHT